MSEHRQKERKKVRTYIEDYFKRKTPKLREIGGHTKVMLGGTTSIYIANVTVKGWDKRTYAFVTVAQSFPQGIIILNSDQLDLVYQRMKDEINEPL